MLFTLHSGVLLVVNVRPAVEIDEVVGSSSSCMLTCLGAGDDKSREISLSGGAQQTCYTGVLPRAPACSRVLLKPITCVASGESLVGDVARAVRLDHCCRGAHIRSEDERWGAWNAC